MSSILDILWDMFRKPKTIPIPTMPMISGDEVRTIISKFGDTQMWVSDGAYTLISTATMQEYLKLNPVDKRAYYVDSHDCDNFALELHADVSLWYTDAKEALGGAFGEVWGNRASDDSGHAWNFFINENKNVIFIEPQNDVMFIPSKEKLWLMVM